MIYLQKYLQNREWCNSDWNVVNGAGNQPGIVVFDGGDVEAPEKQEII